MDPWKVPYRGRLFFVRALTDIIFTRQSKKMNKAIACSTVYGTIHEYTRNAYDSDRLGSSGHGSAFVSHAALSGVKK